MIGLSLSGGGVKGSYHIGVYYAFKKCHIKIDGVCGTSIGSFNGAMIAAHKEKELLNFWQNANIGEILGIDEKLVKKINNKENDFELLKLRFEQIKKILQNEGVAIDGLLDVVKKYDLEPLVRNSDIEYGLCTFRMKDLKPLDLFIDDIKEGSLDSFIMASCYLPIFKKEKLEDNSYYFDGGIYNVSPYNMLLMKGYDKVYSIELNAVGRRQKPLFPNKVITISPSRKLTPILSVDQKSIKNNIKIGYYDALKVLKKYDGEKFLFKNKSDNYYKRVTRNLTDEDLAFLAGFLNAKNEKQIVIRMVEYLMLKEDYTYFKLYSISRVLRKLKKSESSSVINRYLKKLS